MGYLNGLCVGGNDGPFFSFLLVGLGKGVVGSRRTMEKKETRMEK